jgi:hypothetical protein
MLQSIHRFLLLSLAIFALTAELVGGTSHPVSVTVSALPSNAVSIEIDIYASGGKTPGASAGPWLFNLGSGTQKCSAATEGRACTVTVKIPYGAYDVAVTGFPQRDAAGNPLTWGKTHATVTATRNAFAVKMGSKRPTNRV